MKLQFERFLETQNFSDVICDLFHESTTCYKASAYRAALLFSYLGFLTILKERIIRSQPPNGFNVNQWNQLQSCVQNDDTWDREVFNTTQRRTQPLIFIINDSCRQEIMYWKNRRNDCAHSKRGTIGHALVEAFWIFLEENISKLVVNGSRASLLNRIDIHFNPSFTPPDQDYSDIIREIEHAVEESDLCNFYDEVKQVITTRASILPSSRPPRILLQFFDSILSSYGNYVSDRLAEYIQRDFEFLFCFLRNYPSKILIFNLDPRILRNLWYERIFDSYLNDWPIYCSMLLNRLISPPDISSSHDRLISRKIGFPPTEAEKRILDENNFFDIFRQKAFCDCLIDEFDWATSNRVLVEYYLKNYNLDCEIVQAIYYVFNKPNHPFRLAEVLNTFFSENTEKKDEFKRIAESENIDLPVHLPALAT